MTVYVDDARNRFKRMIMCHMMADDEAELHAMARAIGMKRSWFQSGDHYDVALGRKAVALTLGAKLITVREMARLRRGQREKRNASAKQSD